jgi:hypothetical protein
VQDAIRGQLSQLQIPQLAVSSQAANQRVNKTSKISTRRTPAVQSNNDDDALVDLNSADPNSNKAKHNQPHNKCKTSNKQILYDSIDDGSEQSDSPVKSKRKKIKQSYKDNGKSKHKKGSQHQSQSVFNTSQSEGSSDEQSDSPVKSKRKKIKQSYKDNGKSKHKKGIQHQSQSVFNTSQSEGSSDEQSNSPVTMKQSKPRKTHLTVSPDHSFSESSSSGFDISRTKRSSRANKHQRDTDVVSQSFNSKRSRTYTSHPLQPTVATVVSTGVHQPNAIANVLQIGNPIFNMALQDSHRELALHHRLQESERESRELSKKLRQSEFEKLQIHQQHRFSQQYQIKLNSSYW